MSVIRIMCVRELYMRSAGDRKLNDDNPNAIK